MFVKYKFKKLKTLNGEEYDIPLVTYYHLKEIAARQKNKFDNVIVITGGVGSGKSNGAKGICGSYEEAFNNRIYNTDKVHFLIQDVMEEFNRVDNFGEAINYDEAVQGGTGKDGLTRIGYLLRKAFITKRKKGHLITLSIDNPKELNDKIIERCVAWYHCFYIRTREGRYIKGLFKVFSPKQLQLVYDDLKKYHYRFVEQHPIYKKKTTVYKFKNYSNIFYDEGEYDKKKDEQTNLMEAKDNLKTFSPEQITALKLKLKGLPNTEIASRLNRDRGTIGNWLKDMVWDGEEST